MKNQKILPEGRDEEFDAGNCSYRDDENQVFEEPNRRKQQNFPAADASRLILEEQKSVRYSFSLNLQGI